jgi:hypothetical protein
LDQISKFLNTVDMRVLQCLDHERYKDQGHTVV